MSALQLKKISVSAGKTSVVDNIDLTIGAGELHILMGPNGSGKSTLLNAAMGNPSTTITSGSVIMNDNDITNVSTEERARKGLFLAFQYPPDIAGVTLGNFTRLAKNSQIEAREPSTVPIGPADFVKQMTTSISEVGLPVSFIGRSVNEGFSGGEKKRSELLQMMILQPQFAMLDEIDSGVDVDALSIIADVLNTLRATTQCGILLVTHQGALLDKLEPTAVHIMSKGKIIKSGDKDLIKEILTSGYESLEL
ncbi:MAG: Fe-S cluster assembly ATPase SufC [bacterium]|nr:Fe-S cluster assembly ATPase SufC [bacterium]